MAYNEEVFIRSALADVIKQQQNLVYVDEIIVIISGSNDATEDIARSMALDDSRIRVIIEAERTGKIYSVIHFLNVSRNAICVLSSADVFAEEACFDNLAAPLIDDPAVGMTGPRVIPSTARRRRTLALRLHDELWEIHHELALTKPKLGELVMVRKEFVDHVPTVSGCDEVMLEAAVIGSGAKLMYAPTAIVHNVGAAKIGEYFRTRSRNHTMHLVTHRKLHYDASTLRLRTIFGPLVKYTVQRPKQCIYIVVLLGFEVAARSRARWSFYRGETKMTWEPTRSARVHP
jgi:cellulose synthase/poly-beta-1,6-N-acetylglucosamine synthase-like glycosyltransferase